MPRRVSIWRALLPNTSRSLGPGTACTCATVAVADDRRERAIRQRPRDPPVAILLRLRVSDSRPCVARSLPARSRRTRERRGRCDQSTSLLVSSCITRFHSLLPVMFKVHHRVPSVPRWCSSAVPYAVVAPSRRMGPWEYCRRGSGCRRGQKKTRRSANRAASLYCSGIA
jgi:hypothetical protein